MDQIPSKSPVTGQRRFHTDSREPTGTSWWMGPGALLTAEAPVSSDAKPAEAPPSCVRSARNSPRHAERQLPCHNRRCTLPATCKHVTVEHTSAPHTLPWRPSKIHDDRQSFYSWCCVSWRNHCPSVGRISTNTTSVLGCNNSHKMPGSIRHNPKFNVSCAPANPLLLPGPLQVARNFWDRKFPRK